ncbi:glutamine synthetase family protein [Xinfangfangia sp. CPCC 101601]|uniref:Glutamine synthetase family protein n=1 Tax=Pseudogemmobacter lacusdianii TaxID=3069608 RepID=A0ABU0VU60_9RHOB|nr:glutamine synthetase family protein [Xinfangfangia sp. CPCC 101601]MDQ2065266.1 glutamine synthetase family protein [Xinfangfangia sp. CPCC 101601]
MSERLRAMFCDHLSIMRGKYLPASKIGNDESRFAQPNFSVHYDKDLLLEAPGSRCLQGLPDMVLRWIGDEVRPGWEPATKVVLGDLYDAEGGPLPMCPRGALKRAVAAWGKHGLTPKIGIELEAFAFIRNADGQIVPYDNPGGVVYGTGNFTDPRRFTDAIWNKAHEIGLPLDLITAEYDTPQFEFTLTFDTAVAHVDSVVLFRQMAREIALDHGVILSFLPKPIAGKGGSGLHVNLSFTDAKGQNALAKGERGDPDDLSDLARGCISGWMQHHKAIAGLVAPNALSYARLQPASLSGYWCNWGGDNRNVTARVSAEGGKKARLEHRMPDAAANPYTSVATILQAALLGYEGKYDLPPRETGDGFTCNDAPHGTAASLSEAIDDLAADTALGAAVGQGLVDNHIFMKRAEVEKTAGLEGDALRDWYIWYI